MAAFVPTVLPALDAIRSVGDLLGLRPYAVYIINRVWSGERPGVGTKTDTTTQMLNTDAAGNTHPVMVKQVSRRDVIASGGTYSDQMLKVGPMTPSYTGGGVTTAGLDPAPTSYATELFWKVTGPGLPSGGAYFAKVDESATALHYYVTIKRLAVAP